MKITLNQIKHLAPVEVSDDELVRRIGAQLGGIEETESIGSKYDGVVVVRVVSCDDHPDADRLRVCLVDDGGKTPDVDRNADGLVQVVCGAPNVHAGATVAWLPPGATVPSTFDSDPFVLEARALRGVVSNGMLASPKELSIGDSHEGLLLLEGDIEPGTMFADHFGLRGDTLIDIENKMFTHRPDCFGWLGIAREVAGIQGLPFASPEWYRADTAAEGNDNGMLPLEVRNEIPELVPRFSVITMSNIVIGPSPVWLQIELARVGLRPINNIVDLTNYYMLLTGQPLHAYDYDKVRAQDEGADHATIVVRKPRDDEQLVLLNGKTIKPRSEAILIASATQAIGLGGVMGGADTEVSAETTNIILEAASFNMYSIRRTSMAHGIFSDAVTRFNKGQSPLQTVTVLSRIAKDVAALAGGEVSGPLIDDNRLPADMVERSSVHPPVEVGVEFINLRLGLKLEAAEMAQLLMNVEFQVQYADDTLTIQAPFWRTDIELPEDIVEEIGRLYGFDRLPLELPLRSTEPTPKDALLTLKSRIREILASGGANEALTYSFVHGKLLENTGQSTDYAFKLTNALSPDLQYYRLSLTPSLLDKVHANIKAGYDEFALFELGKSHVIGHQDVIEPEVPKENNRLAFVYAADSKALTNHDGAAFYMTRNYLQQLMQKLGISTAKLRFVTLADTDFDQQPALQQLVAPYEPKRSALVLIDTPDRSEQILGVVGEIRSSVKRALKLPDGCAAFEVDTGMLQSALNGQPVSSYVPLPKYPSVSQDMTLKVPADLPYRTLYDVVFSAVTDADETNSRRLLLSPLDIYQRPDDLDHKQVTMRLTVASYEKTMTDAEVSAVLDKAAAAAGEAFGAVRI